MVKDEKTTDDIGWNNHILKSKQDQAKTISVSYIQKSIEKAKMNLGDMYDKAETSELLFSQQKSLSSIMKENLIHLIQ